MDIFKHIFYKTCSVFKKLLDESVINLVVVSVGVQ